MDQDGSTILTVDNSFPLETTSAAVSQADPAPAKKGEGEEKIARSTVLKRFNITMSRSEGSDAEDNITQMLLGKNGARQLLCVSRLMENRQTSQAQGKAGDSGSAKEATQIDTLSASLSNVVKSKGPSRAAKRKGAGAAGRKRKWKRSPKGSDVPLAAEEESRVDTVVEGTEELDQPPSQMLSPPPLDEESRQGSNDVPLVNEGSTPNEDSTLKEGSIPNEESLLVNGSSQDGWVLFVPSSFLSFAND